jgi:hypothetical protein
MVAYNDGFNVYDALIGESRYPIPSIPYSHITIYPACDSVSDTIYPIPYTGWSTRFCCVVCLTFAGLQSSLAPLCIRRQGAAMLATCRGSI